MSFRDFLSNTLRFTKEEVEITTSLFEDTTLLKKEYFVKEGQISYSLAIVTNGLLRRFFINEDGDEVTTQFIEPPELAISIDSMNNRKPAKENIIAVEPTQILSITIDNWNLLCHKIPKWNEICKTVGDQATIKLVERAKELQTCPAAERYHKFCKEHPAICQKVTLGQIASYLGIDISTLSRIRKQK